MHDQAPDGEEPLRRSRSATREQLKQCISRLRNVDSVFDAYRVTPTG